MSSKATSNVQNSNSETPITKADIIEGPTNIKHISHVTWTKGKGFEINTDDEELAQVLQKAFTNVPQLDSEEDVVEFVSSEFQTTKKSDGIYISYPFNVRHVVHCSQDETDGSFNIVKSGNVVKLEIEKFLKKHSDEK